MKVKKVFGSIAAAAALVAGSAHAAPVTVSGVTWDPDYGADFISVGTVNEKVAVVAGDTIKGYGSITEVNDSSTFCSGCELTYTFSGYTLLNSLTGTLGEAFQFTGGILNIYVDSTPDYATATPGSAGDGLLWLSLVGNTSAFASLGYTMGETLVGTLTNPSTAGLGAIAGEGSGYMDVVGGVAAAYFDTDGQIGDSDLLFTSTFAPRRTPIIGVDGTVYTHSGGISVSGDSTTVPEPGALALLGLGLAGLGFARRNKKQV